MARDRASDPQNWTAFFSFTIILHSLPLTTDKADGIDCVSICFLCQSETLVGSGGVYRRFLRTKTCAQTTRVSCTPRTSCERTVCRPDPTRRVNMSVFFSTEVFIVNWRADVRKCNKKLSYRRGIARCVVSVKILPIAKQQCRKYLYDKSWTNRSYEVGGLKVGRCVINMCTQPWRDRVASIVLWVS